MTRFPSKMGQTQVLQTAVAVALTAALSARTAAPQPQTAPPTFRSEVSYVEVNARVLDGSGQFVRGLGQDDFEVIEDGRPQRVSTFALVDLPFLRPVRPAFLDPLQRAIDPDVASNVDAASGRLYVIVLDDLHISAHRTARARDIARRFILDHLDVNDRVSFVVTSGYANASQEVTASRTPLLRAIDNVTGRKLPSAMEAKAEQFARDQAAAQAPDPDAPGRDPLFNMRAPRDEDEAQRGYHARTALAAIRGVAEWMSSVQGRRKSIVFISEGFDFDLSDVFAESTVRDPNSFFSGSGGGTQAPLVLADAKAAMNAATRNNVTVYTVDPRGLALETMEASLGGVSTGSTPTTALQQRTVGLGRDLLGSHAMLEELAAATGGFAAVNANDLTPAFSRIVDENSRYYLLGYVSSNAGGRPVRTIQVRVPGRDVRVLHRTGYAPSTARATNPAAADPAARLAEAAANPVPAVDLPLRATVLPHRAGNGATLDVFVEISGRELDFEQTGDTYRSLVTLSIAAFDEQGAPVSKPELTTVQLTLKPDTYARVARSGARVWKPLQATQGRRYQVRIAAHEAAGGQVGSITADVDVPGFSKEPVSLGGLALASSADPSVASFRNPLQESLPAPPTLLRLFPSGSELALSVRVYHNNARPQPRLALLTEVREATSGKTVFENREDWSERAFDGGRGEAYAVRIPLTGWAAGTYVLTTRAAAGAADASRSVLFEVR